MNVSQKKLAHWIGFFYLLIIICGLMSSLYVRDALVVPQEPLATLQNIIAYETLYRIGFLSDLTMVIADVVVAILFYKLLQEVQQEWALSAAVFRLMQAAVLAVNLLHLFQPVLMLPSAEQLSDAQALELGESFLLQLQIFEYGYLISGVFFGVNCLLMGYLLYKASFFPKLLGGLLGLAGIGYLFNSIAHFAAPNLTELSSMVMFFTAVVAELSLCFYLLIKGVATTS